MYKDTASCFNKCMRHEDDGKVAWFAQGRPRTLQSPILGNPSVCENWDSHSLRGQWNDSICT